MLVRMGLEIRSLKVVGDHRRLGSMEPGTVVTEKDAARLPVTSEVRALCLDLEVEGGAQLVESVAGLCS
ncbi:MAG: hypothetical protein QGG40_08570 [Myxococcota bacterium]|nr:hypothetical protein [Myxococcota bacterium]